MLKLVLLRTAFAIPMLLAVAVVVFILFSFSPVDAAAAILGTDATEASRAEVERELGLDRPFIVQMIDWIGRAFLLDFGNSYVTNRPIADDIAARLPATLAMCIGGLIVSLVVGIIVGVVCAQHPNSWLDRSLTVVTSVFLALPGFWLAILLVLLLAVQLGLLPSSGYVPFERDPWLWLRSLVIPWLALGLSAAATIARQTRSAMLETLGATFVRAAVARGASRTRAVYVYALKNAMMPVLAVIGIQFTVMIGSSFVIERIFSIPGTGTLMLDGLLRGDTPMLQATVLVVACSVIVINTLVDIGYGLLNPKVRPQ